MKDLYRVGIDLAKQNFELCGVNRAGGIVFRKSLKRNKLSEFIANLPKVIICMEACGGSNYWARKFRGMGHEIQLIPGQHVKAFLKSQKNDSNDALAITEASARPTMSFVAIKEPWQQDLQSIHRVRTRVVKNLLEVSNQIRGLLGEYGVVMSQGVTKFKASVLEVLETENDELTIEIRDLVHELYEEYSSLEAKKNKYSEKLEKVARENPICKRLTELPGVGPMTCTAFVSHIGDANFYKNGRQAAASLGLVPRQHSSGGKQKLLGITKRGDKHLRSLLVHGARSYVRVITKKVESEMTDYEIKIRKMIDKKHVNKVIVAVANRNARVMLAMMKNGEGYRMAG